MATFSPFPSPPRSAAMTSPPRRLQPPSRFVTPARAVKASEGSQNSETSDVYAQYNELRVAFYADLPVEVRQEISREPGLNDSFHHYFGSIDTTTKYAVATSTTSCFVWQHSQNLQRVPTCYIFPAPPSLANAPAFAAFVPYGASREPGLILLSSGGELRFWDSISLGLAGADFFISDSLSLTNELVTYFVRVDPQLYVASTDQGRLFRIGLSSAGGKTHLNINQLVSGGRGFSITGLLPSLLGTGHDFTNSGYVYSLSVDNHSPPDCRELLVLVGRKLQKWRISSAGAEILLDLDAMDVIQNEVQGYSTQNLDLLDVVVTSKDELTVLVSSTSFSDGDEMADVAGPRCVYYLVFLSVDGTSISVNKTRGVAHQSSTNSPTLHPRLHSLVGNIVLVQFGDAVCILARDSQFTDRLELKKSTDQILSVGVNPDAASFLVLTAHLMLKVDLDLAQIASFDADASRVHLASSVMMQAILFGSNSKNPLRFSFPPEVSEESVSSAAEQLSAAVLRSDPKLFQPLPNFDAEMTAREARLAWQISFINENGVLNKLPPGSRQRLASHAEKLYASHQLWLAHQEHGLGDRLPSVLRSSIMAYMSSKSLQYEDPTLSFFRYHIENITDILVSVSESVESLSAARGEPVLHLLAEANDVVLIVINSALEHREHNLKLYGISFPMHRPWTSEREIIELTHSLLQMTTKHIESTRRDQGDPSLDKPRSQLPELVAVILGCIRERLDWLGSDPYFESERNDLMHKYLELRPSLIDILCRFGFIDPAFTLAEKDRDFASLVALCNRAKIFPPESNPYAERILKYIETYEEDFVDPLLQWYIRHGELRLLFSDAYSVNRYLNAYFEKHEHPAIAWLWWLQQNRESTAASMLLTDATQTSNLGAKQFMLSLGKLAYLAQNGQCEQNVLDCFDGALDSVGVHHLLVEELGCTPQELHSRQSLDTRLKSIRQRTAPGLGDQPYLADVYEDLLQRLLTGQVLNEEDLIDVLTLKDNGRNGANYSTALNLLEEAQTIPAARSEVVCYTIWRRIYLQDDWTALSKALSTGDPTGVTRLRDTVLFSVLNSQTTTNGSPHQVISPDLALITPSREQIASRWSGISASQLDGLEQDYNLERDMLGEMEILPNLLQVVSEEKLDVEM